MYEYRNEEVLVLEAIANGIDAKARKIDTKFDVIGADHYVTFHNDGPPMNKGDFDNYHTISSSTKTKGEGIGFAGVGAKIFLAAWSKAEIITITGKDDKILASRMFREKNNVVYISSAQGDRLENIVGNRRRRHRNGTSYQVKLTKEGYNWLEDNIKEKLQFWFNYALTSNKLELTVNGKRIEPWMPAGDKYKKILKYKNRNIPYYMWISRDDIPEERRHIVFSVFGKRIKNETVDFAYQIKGDNSNKVFCMADVSLLAEHLVANKENFKKNYFTNSVRSAIKMAFYKELAEKGYIAKQASGSQTNVIVNNLTRKLDKALQTPDLKFLNPFSNPRVRYVPVTDDEGKVTMKEVEGKQKVNDGSKSNGDGEKDGNDGKRNATAGEDSGTSPYEDGAGTTRGKTVQRKSKGVSIIVESYPHDQREGWLDMNNRGVVYNSGHPFAKSIHKNISLFDYNVVRVVIASLIKSKNEQAEMDAKTALEYFERILHQVWP